MGLILDTIFFIIICILIYLIWYYVWGGPCNNNDIKSHFTVTRTGENFYGNNYKNPIWNQSVYGAKLLGYTSSTPYDNYANSAIECANYIKSEASQSGDKNVIGWTWDATQNGPGYCRAVTNNNVKNPCYTIAQPSSQSYISKLAIDHLKMQQCKKN